MKNTIKVIIFLMIMCLIMSYLSSIFRPAWNTDVIIQGYTKEKTNSIDVLFVGDSDIYAGISPMEIYKDTGITSFDYSSAAAANLLMYYMMRRALKYQSPKVVVMDLSSVFGYKEGEANTHRAIDPTPLDKLKLEFINDKGYHFDIGNKLTYIFPFLRFHDRWDEISSNDFTKNRYQNITYNSLKGFDFNTTVQAATNGDTYMNDNGETANFLESDLPEAIIKSKEYCESHNIKFLLLAMPDTSTWSYAKYQKITEWAKENNIEYLDTNVLLNDIGIDYDTDSKDGGMHLNVYGATKVSKYLANYLSTHYDLTDHRQDSYYSNWNEDLESYNKRLEALNVQN